MEVAIVVPTAVVQGLVWFWKRVTACIISDSAVVEIPIWSSWSSESIKVFLAQASSVAYDESRMIYYLPEIYASFSPTHPSCYFVNPAEKVLQKDEYWEQPSFSLSAFTTQRGLLHSLMELYMGIQWRKMCSVQPHTQVANIFIRDQGKNNEGWALLIQQQCFLPRQVWVILWPCI